MRDEVREALRESPLANDAQQKPTLEVGPDSPSTSYLTPHASRLRAPIGRLAPSPTGALHLGNIRTFMAAWLQMRAAGGTVRLRIEDLDHPKHKPGADAALLEDLRWLGFDWDGPVVWQSQRIEAYAAALERLMPSLYPCFCTRADIQNAQSAPHPGEVLRYSGRCRPGGIEGWRDGGKRGGVAAWKRGGVDRGVEAWRCEGVGNARLCPATPAGGNAPCTPASPAAMPSLTPPPNRQCLAIFGEVDVEVAGQSPAPSTPPRFHASTPPLSIPLSLHPSIPPAGLRPAWRLALTSADDGRFSDGFAGPQLRTAAELTGDFVVARGMEAAYALAVVVDDAAMGVTDVVRGDDILPATPAQVVLYRRLGWVPPTFWHLPLVVGADGRRLAKRHGDTRIAAYRAAGVPPGRILSALARSCGWLGPGESVATLAELLPRFSFEAIPREPFVWRADLL